MKKLLLFNLFTFLLAYTLSGCGYQIGLVGKDENIKKMYIYTVINETRKPGLEMPMTNAIINSIHNYGDGIEVTANKEEADSFLVVKLTNFDRTPARFSRANIIEESSATLYAEFKLYKTNVPSLDKDIVNKYSADNDSSQIQVIKPFMERTVSASQNYFLVPNQPEGERSIQPLILDKLSREIVDQIVFKWDRN